jgi:hypothetical protein
MRELPELAALASGLAVTRAVQGAQSNTPTAGQRPPQSLTAVCAPQVGGRLFASPNAIRSVPPPTTNGLFPQPVRAAAIGLPA